MPGDQIADGRDLVELVEPLEVDHVDVAVQRERSVRIQYIRDPAAHAGGKVSSRAAEDDDPAAGHVLTTVIADTFDDRVRAAVADGEAFAGNTADEYLAA